MKKYLRNIAAAHAGTAMALCAGLVLAACQSGDAVTEDYYVPTTHYERYPIKVVRKPVKLALASKASLQPAQVNAVAALARQARAAGQPRIAIRRPSGGGHGAALSRDIAAVLVQQGIPAEAIVQGTYPGSSKAPVQVGYIRGVAVTTECGDWSDNLSTTYLNRAAPNHGCAVTSNIAAMAVNPDNFVVPEAMPAAPAYKRVLLINQYAATPSGTTP
ncbi:MAG: CpaD family pilus assembly lipoprotein [Hyphomicrobiales bacterium]